MITENVSTLKIHKLTQAQYDRELASGNIDENALYLTPDEAVDSSVLDAHMEDTDKHVTSGEKTNWNAAKTHADSAHAPSNAQANVIESISVNGTKQAITNKAVNIIVPTDNKDLANGAGYLVASNIANKADKATTLSGYGITNAYTKTEVDGKIDGAKSDMTQEIASAIDEITPSSIGAATSSHTHDYAASSHTHDDRYFTESEINTKLSGYSTTSHTHSDYASKDHTHNYAASDHTHSYIPTSEKGAKSGVATLDTNGKVPSSQLPSYVDDVIEGYYYNSKFYKESAHTTEIAGETGKIYIDLSSSKTYRWSGTAYAVISETLALGETSSTAYAGNKGKANADAITALQTQVGTGNVTERITSALSEANEYTNTMAESALAITDANDAETLASANAYTDEKLKGKSDTNHTHNYAGSSTAGGAATSANKVNKTLTVKLNSGTTEGTNMFTFDGSTAKSVNITPSSIGAAASGHTHDYASSTHTHDYAPSNHSHSNYATTTGVTQEIASAIGEITPASIGAAASSHGTHVSYGTSATAIGATASAGSASTVSRSDHTHSLSKAAVTTALGYTPPTSDTNTHYTTKIYAGASGTAANASATSPYIKIVDDSTYRNQIRLIGGGATTVTSDASGNITISSTDNNTTYTSLKNPYSLTIQGNGTTLTNGTYDGSAAKTVNITPSVIGAAASGHSHSDYATKTAVTQEITSAVSAITPSSIGAAASSHNHAASNITSGTLDAARLPAATSSTLGGVKVGSNITVSSGTISLTKANVTAALGYTPPTSDTNTTYSAGTGISLSGTTFSNSGVRSIATGTTNGTISVNTNGTSANVAVKGLGSAAYTNTTAYDPAGAAADAYESAQVYALTQIEAAIDGDVKALDEETLASAKSYTDTKVASYLPLSGGTITGAVTFNASPITKANAFYNSYDTSSGGAVCLIGTVSGNIQIGSKISGQSSSNKNVVVASEHVLRPASNASQTLGTSSYYWGTAYVNKLYIKDPGTTTNSTTTSDTYPMLKWKADGGAVCRYKASSSSRRYKTDIIEGFTDEKLNPENLYNVKLYQYKYKDDHLEKDDQRVGMDLYGFIVEDLVEHYPSAVDLNSKGEPDDWNKTFLIPAMLKLIQNQKLEIDELREDINALNKALNK